MLPLFFTDCVRENWSVSAPSNRLCVCVFCLVQGVGERVRTLVSVPAGKSSNSFCYNCPLGTTPHAKNQWKSKNDCNTASVSLNCNAKHVFATERLRVGRRASGSAIFSIVTKSFDPPTSIAFCEDLHLVIFLLAPILFDLKREVQNIPLRRVSDLLWEHERRPPETSCVAPRLRSACFSQTVLDTDFCSPLRWHRIKSASKHLRRPAEPKLNTWNKNQ